MSNPWPPHACASSGWGVLRVLRCRKGRLHPSLRELSGHPGRPPAKVPRIKCRPNLPTGIKKLSLYGIDKIETRKAVIPLSGKSPKSGSAKKVGKSILEKRADKKAKTETSDLFAKPRKNQR